MSLKIDTQVTAHALRARIERLFDLSAAKILSIEGGTSPEAGAPVHTVRGRYTARGWQVAREEECAACDYVGWVAQVWDSNAWPSPLPVEEDMAAAARAVACCELAKGGR